MTTTWMLECNALVRSVNNFMVHIFSKTNLADEDQCSQNNGGCQHICVNAIPGHNCSCNPGHTLNEDGFKCDGKVNISTYIHI